MSDTKKKRTRKAPPADPQKELEATIRKEVNDLVYSREGKMERLMVYDVDTSLQICRVDKTIIVGEILFASPTRDLSIRVDDSTLSHLICWSDQVPTLRRLLDS